MVMVHGPVQPAPKSIFRSRTFYANVLGAAAQLLNYFGGQPMPPPALVVAQTVVNVALRFATDEPVNLLGHIE